MNDILIALLIGITAGIIDVIPMIIQKLDKFANWSAFFHWVVLGLIIPFVDWEMQAWLKGLIIGVLSAIPIIIMVYSKNKRSIIPILVFSVFLGVGIGIAGEIFIG